MENQAVDAKLQAQIEELEAIKEMLKIKIDGDWDEDMIGTAFDNLEALLCGEVAEDTSSARPKRSAPQQRRRRRR